MYTLFLGISLSYSLLIQNATQFSHLTLLIKELFCTFFLLDIPHFGMKINKNCMLRLEEEPTIFLRRSGIQSHQRLVGNKIRVSLFLNILDKDLIVFLWMQTWKRYHFLKLIFSKIRVNDGIVWAREHSQNHLILYLFESITISVHCSFFVMICYVTNSQPTHSDHLEFIFTS